MKYLLKKTFFNSQELGGGDHGSAGPRRSYSLVRGPLYKSCDVQQVHLITNNFSDTSNNSKINNIV